MDYYEELGLSRTTSLDEIRHAYRQFARLIHPDQQPDEHLRRLAEIQMKRLNQILEVLTDAVQRREYDRSLPRICAYGNELNQVWTNLIDNAADAMQGEGTLTVRTARDGEFALVEIGDTGSGVAPEVAKRVFEPFFTTKPVGQGTGLGLDVSWRVVVSRHHGDLQLHSQPGDTRFQIRLPLRELR